MKLDKINTNKIELNPGGVDLDRFKPSIEKTSIREELDIPEEKIILLTVRNLVHRMGLENLIKALELVVKNTPDIFLVIGGDGPLKNKLITLTNRLGLGDYVRFSGFIPDDDLPDYYRMSDLFVLPTKELEGFGLVTLESMATGLPVVGTPVGGTKEILNKFDSAFLFKDTTPEAMAEIILKYHRIIKYSPQEWKETSVKCRKYVEDNYSWAKNVDELEKLLIE
ncbi:MAG: glycosyltransferase family 4 protein [Desulfobacterales bacterium]|nr:glycosyltransferase family 4 protein [Desulfobacterales bacterium]